MTHSTDAPPGASVDATAALAPRSPLDRMRRRLAGADRATWVLVGLLSVHIGVYGHLKWAMHANFGTFGFDMGIYDQGIWLVSRFADPFVTVRGLDLLANHVDPVWLLFVPAYWLGAGPIFLSVVQTAWVAAGAIPLYLMGRDRLASPWLALGLPVAWLLNPALLWINWFHFHPEALAATPLLFAWWWAGRGRWGWFLAMIVLAVACKESVTMATFVLGLYVAWRWNRRVGLATSAGSLVWFFVATKVIIPWANNGVGPFYEDLYGRWGDSATSVVTGILRHPSEFTDTVLGAERLDYYQQLLAPLAGIPLAGGAVLAVAMPQVVVNVISGHALTYSIRYQYTTVVVAVLFLATFHVVSGRRPGVQRFLVGAVVACSLAASVAWSPAPIYGREYSDALWARHPNPRHVAAHEAMELIPGDAAVSATYSFVPQMSHRRRIYEWPNPFRTSYWGVAGEGVHPPSAATYLLIDRNLVGEGVQPLLEQLLAGDYETLFDKDDVVVARRR